MENSSPALPSLIRFSKTAVHLVSTTTTSAPLRTNERWRPKLSPEWDGPMVYWDDFLDDPPVILLQCRK